MILAPQILDGDAKCPGDLGQQHRAIAAYFERTALGDLRDATPPEMRSPRVTPALSMASKIRRSASCNGSFIPLGGVAEVVES